jgi:hypothetical protein
MEVGMTILPSGNLTVPDALQQRTDVVTWTDGWSAGGYPVPNRLTTTWVLPILPSGNLTAPVESAAGGTGCCSWADRHPCSALADLQQELAGVTHELAECRQLVAG